MPEPLRELLDLILRWTHVVAGIMWIGNSLLFNWLDRTLVPRSGSGRAGPGVVGDTWLLHSGAFYFVEKTLLGGAGQRVELPAPLHWFKWQSYATWLSGVSLLVVVYYLGGRAVLVSPDAATLGTGAAVAVAAGVLAAGWLLYDLVLAPASGSAPAALVIAAALALLLALTWALGLVFAPRAVFLHVGALLGTIMSGNVFRHIIPSQRQMVAAAARGDAPDPALSARAKKRSIHNNYITFPVLALMVSNHFPTLYGHRHGWLAMAAVLLAGAGVRHVLNIRFGLPGWRPALAGVMAAGAAALWLLMGWRPARDEPAPSAALSSGAVAFEDARHIIDRRCGACHSAAPSDSVYRVAPGGVMLDTPEQIRAWAPRIKARAVDTRTMPLGNKTMMTEAERAALGRWVEGADR